jgi:folylpolyglutamate synthase/dihydropteroate synthase
VGPSDLAATLGSFGEAIAGKYDKVSTAYDEALKNCEMGDLILVFGSFPVVGVVLDHLANRRQRSRND